MGNSAWDLISFLRYLNLRGKYPFLPAPWTHLEIDPFALRQSIEPSTFVRSGRYRFSGQVVQDGWGRVIEMPAKHRVLPRVFSALLGENVSEVDQAELVSQIGAEDRELFRQLFDQSFKDKYLQIYDRFRKYGFERANFLTSRVDPFFVCIGQDGEFLFTTGKHRLALAKAAGLRKIPVRVSARHLDWIRYRCEFLERLRNDQLTDQDDHRKSHPDLQDLIQKTTLR